MLASIKSSPRLCSLSHLTQQVPGRPHQLLGCPQAGHGSANLPPAPVHGGHKPPLVYVGLLDSVHQLAEDVLQHHVPGQQQCPSAV